MKRLLVILVLVLLPSVSDATNYYADNLIACTANYNPATRDCTGNSGNSYTTLSAAVAPLQPGDNLYIRSFSGGTGAWNDRVNLQDAGKSGTAGNYISIIGYPGDTVILRYTDTGSYGAIKARGARGYFLFQNLIIDGTNYAVGTVWGIRDGGHHFILRNIEIKNTKTSALYIGGDDIEVTDSYFHDTVSATCDSGSRYYGIYLHDGARVTIERNVFEQNPGGGLQAYPGPLTDIVIAGNVMRNNGSCPSTDHGGMVLGSDSTGTGGGSITNVSVYDNVIYDNGQAGYGGAGTGGNTGGTGHGIRVFYSRPTGSLSGVKINNNTIRNNIGGSSKVAYGIELQGGANNVEVKNNIVLDNENGQIHNVGTGNTITNNICKSADSCGTSKVTVSAITDVTISTSDFRMKQGTNPARHAGATVSTRPAPVGAVDIGAYEQGVITSASVVGEYLELVISVMTPGVLPTSAVTGITVTCGGISPCVGTPTVVSANVKPGSSNVIQVALSGINVIGTGTVSMGATNATDSFMIGGPIGLAQGLDSVSSLSITGSLVNIGGLSSPTPTWSYFKLNEGSGTVANDDTGNGHHGTVSSGITWVSDESGQGVNIPTDATFRHISTTFGSGSNPTTQAFAICVYAKPELSGNTSKVLLSSGGNGASQRWYAGWTMVGGQPQWGIGIQGSGFSTGSEFVVTENLTLVCVVNDSAADTATLWVNGVMGNIVGKSVKSFTSYTLVGHLRVGNDGTFASNNGGFTVYDVWVWDTMPPLSDIVDLYDSLAPVSSVTGLTQSQVQWEHVYTNASLAPRVITPRADFSTDVVVNGGIAFRVQYDCTGGACANIAPRLYYSTDGTNFNLPVPQTLGVNHVAMWGSTADTYFNDGVSSGCIDGTGFTENSGVTIADSVAGQTFALSNNHCRSDRYVIQVGNSPGTNLWFRVKSDAGQSFAAYSQVIKLTIIPMQAEIGF